MNQAWVSGEYLPEDEAKISIFDRGVVIGDGVFETVFATQGIPEFFNLHFNRLISACEKLKIGLNFTEGDFREVIKRLCALNALEKAAIRITLTRGQGLPGLDIQADEPGNLFITAKAVPQATRQVEDIGLTMCFSQYSSHQASGLDPSIKSTNYLVNIMAKHEAMEKGFDDAIFLGANGCVAEATTATIFFTQDDTIYTPSLDSGILPGITRQVFIENIQRQGFDLEERQIMPNELSEMEEVFITSSLRGSKSVVKINEFEYQTSGKWTRKLRDLYFESAKNDYLSQL